MRALRKLLVVQEFGLVAVIAVMMAGLWFFTPSIPRPQRVNIEPGQSVTATASGFLVSGSGTERTFSTKEGWTLFERGSVRRLEQKQQVLLPASATVQESDELSVSVGAPFMVQTQSGWRVSNAGSADGQYASGEGHFWTLIRNDDGTAVLQRDPMVNKFLNTGNLMIVVTSASFFAIMAVGLTAIIVLGGIDLSVGAIYALASVVGATVLNKMQAGAAADSATVGTVTSLLVGVGVCCGVGVLCGLINGTASVGLGVHPFIITLGGMGIYRGTAFVITKGLSVSDLPPGYSSVVRTKVLGGIEPVPLLAMLATGIAGAWVFTQTVFGRQIFAVGGNETAAKYAGISVGKTKVWVFALAGLLAGLSAAIALGKYGAASSADGGGYELEVIAAAVVGGASLTGGRGTALGAVLGAVVIQLINNGFEVLAIDANYKQIVIGFAIVLAVVVDQVKGRMTSPQRRH